LKLDLYLVAFNFTTPQTFTIQHLKFNIINRPIKTTKTVKAEALDMDYNSSLAHLVLPEYGRNIQRMVEFAVTVQDRQERNKVAQAIIVVMGQLNPHLRDVTDFKHKLWDHIFIISDFKLDVDSPYPLPTRETFITKPDRISYPSGKIKYKPYGKVLESIIAKAREYPEGEEKTYLIEVIANLLKRSYLIWNRDSVNDEVILKHLEELSGGELKLLDVSKLNHTNDILARNRTKKFGENNNASPGNNPGGGGGKHGKGGGHRHDNKHGKFKRNNPYKGDR
jgi:hypothetical protein